MSETNEIRPVKIGRLRHSGPVVWGTIPQLRRFWTDIIGKWGSVTAKDKLRDPIILSRVKAPSHRYIRYICFHENVMRVICVNDNDKPQTWNERQIVVFFRKKKKNFINVNINSYIRFEQVVYVSFSKRNIGGER